MSITIVLFGVIGIKPTWDQRNTQSVDPPVISVRTSYTGANADVIEAPDHLRPLEERLMVFRYQIYELHSNDGTSNIKLLEFRCRR